MQTLTRHTNFVLFAAFATYVYRDVWSFATFTEFPVDDVSPLLWAKIGILTFTGVLIPLFVPRKYVPVDPEVSGSEAFGVHAPKKFHLASHGSSQS